MQTPPKLNIRKTHASKSAGRAAFLAGLSLVATVAGADAETERRLKELEQQNVALQKQLSQQQRVIEDLAGKLSAGGGKIEASSAETEEKRGVFGQVRISGEGGVGIFHTTGGSQFKHSDFRVDEAKLFVEAPLWKNYAFAFAELDLTTRERQTLPNPGDNSFHLGELYVDFEGVSRLWNRPGMLGVRVGRIDIPFGEEYATRDVIDNPLISHSLSDIWGVDEGIELYGAAGQVDYVLAVQNGGHSSLADFHRDKSVTGRLGWKPAKWVRLSGSAMRTGALDAQNDFMSEMWFGNGFFRALGNGATLFQANVYEGDAQVFWDTGHFKAAGGWVDFSDNAAATENSGRDIYYYYAEVLQRVPQLTKLSGAARVSQIFADGGFPIVGHGDFGNYYFNPFAMTERMTRVSVGGGYHFSEHLKLAVEYTLDRRREISGETEDSHFFAAEVGFAF